MSIKVIFDSYSDICRYYMYGRTLLDLPEKVIDRLNEHFDGTEFKQFDGCNPDNIAINYFKEVDTEEALIECAKILNHGEYEQLMNEDQIVSRLSESYTYLGHEGDSWFLLE